MSLAPCRLLMRMLLCTTLATIASLSQLSPVFAQHTTGYSPYATKFFDGIPNWGLNATITAVRSGNWNSPATWSPARVPSSTDTVLILAGFSVSMNVSPTIRTLVLSGTLNFSTTVASTLSATTILVRPDGTLNIGSRTAPIRATLQHRILLQPSTYSIAEDPEQHAGGILVLGKFHAYGALKTPFARLVAAAPINARSITLAEPVHGWAVGDRVAIPDSRDPYVRYTTPGQSPSRSEIRTITAISPDNYTITFNTTLAYTHPASRARTGEKPYPPHLLNLSRNITISSAQPTGKRGHVFVGDTGRTEFSYVGFYQVGRTRIDALDPLTNHIGRYSLHFHHCTGPVGTMVSSNGLPIPNPYRSRVEGCAFEDSPKWHVSIHGTSKVLLQGNAFYGAKGAAVVTEDGNERDNEILGNIAVNCAGSGEKEPGLRVDKKDFGSEGAGFWLSGSANSVRNNIAADCGLIGLLVFPHASSALKYPLNPTDLPDQFKELPVAGRDFLFHPIPYEDNEVYGCPRGIEFWGPSPFTVKDSVVWNCHVGFSSKQAFLMDLDGLVIRGNPTGPRPATGWPISQGIDSIWHQVLAKMKNLDILGPEVGILSSSSIGVYRGGTDWQTVYDINIENSVFNCPIGVSINADLHYKRFAGPSRAYIRNCRFGPIAPGGTYQAIQSILTFANDQDMLAGDEIWVENFQSRPGEHWRLFYYLQAPNIIVPHASPYRGIGNLPPAQDSMTYYDGTNHFRINGLDEVGLTNAQAWTRYGKAIAGAVAPTTRHAEMDGYTQRVSQVPAPYPTKFNLVHYGLDFATDRALQGYAMDMNNSGFHVKMDVYVDGVKRDQITANFFHPETNWRMRFQWTYPSWLLDGRSHEIKLVDTRFGTILPRFPIRVTTAKL